MSNFRNFFSYITCCFLFYSCTFSTTKLNEKADQLLAEKITGEFYHAIREKKYTSSVNYFSEAFSKKTDTVKLFKFYRDYEKKTGIITKTSLVSCQTKSIKERDTIYKSFVVIYHVERSIKPTEERFILKSTGNAEPRIYRYDIDDKSK
ncbi:hypothetical protein [Pedobacter jamesrossensis]|uniref:hypothetical protein n=1 Tax=Pedobacter jamesrossensis TaxID=1908238 RepID=UPI00362220CD